MGCRNDYAPWRNERWTAICYYVLHDGIYDYIYSTMNLLVISY